MPLKFGSIARDLSVAARLGARSLARRIRSPAADRGAPDIRAWRAELEDWIRTLPAGLVAEHR